MPATRTATRAAPSPQRTTVTNSALGAAIRRSRRRQGLLLHALADTAGINNKVMSRIELGERPCRVAEMVSIAKALQTTPEALLEMADEIGQNPLTDFSSCRI